jgi:hypothetical protein
MRAGDEPFFNVHPPEATTVSAEPRVVLYDCGGRPLIRQIGFRPELAMSKKGKGSKSGGKGKGGCR